MWLTCLASRKFLCRYPLSLGASVFAIIFTCLKIACIIGITTEMLNFAKCESCTRSVLRSAYGFSGTSIIYCIIMICMHLLFIWAIRKGNSSIVLIWVVVTTVWLLQSFCLTVVLLFMFMADASFVTWVLCLIFGIFGFGIAAYALSVGFGLWLELKPLTTATARTI